MKKLTSLVLVLAMLMGLFCMAPTVHAATVLPGAGETAVDSNVWNPYYNGDADVTTTIGVTSAYAFEGTNSLHLTYRDVGTDWPYAELMTKAKFPAGNYTFSAYVKHDGTVQIGVLDNNKGNGRHNLGDTDGTVINETTGNAAKDAEGWVKKSVNIRLSSEQVFKFVMIGHGTYVDTYLDNLSLVKEGTTENLLADIGTFDPVEPIATATPAPTATPETDTTEEALDSRWAFAPNNATASKAVTTAKVKYAGERSLHLSRTGTSGNANIWLNKKLPNGTYTMSAIIKEVQNNGSVTMAFYGWGGNPITNAVDKATAPNGATYVKEDMGDGWVKYSQTHVIDASSSNLQPMIYLNNGTKGDDDSTEIYVDNWTITRHEDGKDYLFGAGNFEKSTDKSINDSPTWAYSPNNATDYTAAVSEEWAYEGSKSLHLKRVGALNESNNAANIWWDIKNNITESGLPKGNYEFSVYVKTIWNQGSMGMAVTSWTGANLTGLTKEETGKDGWVKYTQNIQITDSSSCNRPTFYLYTDKSKDKQVVECYIDNWILTNTDTGQVLLKDEGSFEDIVVQPDLTGTVPNKDFWNCAHNSATDTIWETTMEEAYEGERSLHFRRANYASSSNFWPKSAMLTAGQKYTMTAYIKVKEQKGGSIKLAFHNWQGESITGGNVKKEPSNKYGWWKYTMEATVGASYPNGPMIIISTGASDVVDIYIDNISIVDASGNVVAAMGTEGTFERATTGTFEVSDVKLFDTAGGTFTEVTAIGTAQSGKTLTAAVSILNRDANNALDAQLIVAVFKGDEMEIINIPEGVSITKEDGLTTLTGEITLPTITSEDEYTVKVYVWDSFDNMIPLKKTVAEF